MQHLYPRIFIRILPLLFLLFFFALPGKAQQSLVYFWYFGESIPNNTPLEEIEPSYNLSDQASLLQYISALEGYPFDSEHPLWRKASMERRNNPTPINYRAEANQGLPYDATLMRAIQIKQPFGGDAGENTLIFHLPTTGFRDVVFSFAAVDELAAQTLIIDYSLHEEPLWVSEGITQNNFTLSDTYQLYTVDFSDAGIDIEEANENPYFKIRIRFIVEDMAEDLGHRVTFNNFSLEGIPLDDINHPPLISQPPGLQKTIADGQAITIALNDVFSDPDNDPLTFTASSNRPGFVEASLTGSTLTLLGLAAGDALITVTADDSHNPPVSHQFRALVYPAAYDMASGDFQFLAWSPNESEYTYPPHMIFLQSDIPDPDFTTPLVYPYFIPHKDYHADDEATLGMPYNNTRRTRINALADEGISFINTGRNRDLGGALVALNTTGQESLKINFLAGTVLRNDRLYALRLQYRTGWEGDFHNLMHNSQLAEYIASADGHTQHFESIELPAELLNQPYIQLLWRYHHIGGDSGPRTEIRLDDIAIGAALSTQHPAKEGFTAWSYNQGMNIETPDDTPFTAVVMNITGQTVYAESISGKGIHRLSHTFSPGIYILRLQSAKGVSSKKIMIR